MGDNVKSFSISSKKALKRCREHIAEIMRKDTDEIFGVNVDRNDGSFHFQVRGEKKLYTLLQKDIKNSPVSLSTSLSWIQYS